MLQDLSPSWKGDDDTSHYMRAQGRVLTCLELWAIARGDDLRGNLEEFMSVAKLHGSAATADIVGPDQLYKLMLLKDESKANKAARPELIGATRHRDPLMCAVNAVSTMLLLRYGSGGIVGSLPDFFDMHCCWTEEESFLTGPNGKGQLTYEMHDRLFDNMKKAAGMTMLMNECSTKLRSFGAMAANEHQAHHDEIERAGR